MTDQLDSKIRAFVAELVDDPPPAPEISFEALEQPAQRPLHQAPSKRRRWLPAVAFGGAAALVLVIVGLPILFLGDPESVTPRDEATTVSTTIPRTTAAPTTGPPTTTASADPVADSVWTQVPHDEGLGGDGNQAMWGVTVGGPGFVAVGYDAASDGWENAAVWTSGDGITWTRVSQDGLSDDEGHQVMWGVMSSDPGLVAVGRHDKAGDSVAAVWTSPDGIVWSRVPHDEAVFGGSDHQWMWSVTEGGPGLVAVGHEGTFEDRNAAVWTSPDGIVWSRVPHDEAVFGGSGHQVMLSVTAGGPGLVAVSYDSEGGDRDAAVWTSPDGIVWSRVPHDEAVFGGDGDQQMMGIAGSAAGLIAVGYDASGGSWDGAVWTSIDGVAWNRVAHDDKVFGGAGDQVISSVAVESGQVIAVGSDSSGGNDDAAVWKSVDGITWLRLDDGEMIFGGPDDQAMSAVMSDGSSLVAVGYAIRSDDDSDAAVWVTSPPG